MINLDVENVNSIENVQRVNSYYLWTKISRIDAKEQHYSKVNKVEVVVQLNVIVNERSEPLSWFENLY